MLRVWTKTQVLHLNFMCIQQNIMQQSSMSKDGKESVRQRVEITPGSVLEWN